MSASTPTPKQDQAEHKGKYTPDQLVAAVRRIVIEVQQDGNYALIDEFISEDWTDHTRLPRMPTGREGVHAAMRYIHSAFSDVKIEIVSSIADAETLTVATNKVIRGKWVGNWKGEEGKGQKIEVRIMDFLVMGKEGKFTEHWACIGDLKEI